jgi:hypothetical protein
MTWADLTPAASRRKLGAKSYNKPKHQFTYAGGKMEHSHVAEKKPSLTAQLMRAWAVLLAFNAILFSFVTHDMADKTGGVWLMIICLFGLMVIGWLVCLKTKPPNTWEYLLSQAALSGFITSLFGLFALSWWFMWPVIGFGVVAGLFIWASVTLTNPKIVPLSYAPVHFLTAFIVVVLNFNYFAV